MAAADARRALDRGYVLAGEAFVEQQCVPSGVLRAVVEESPGCTSTAGEAACLWLYTTDYNTHIHGFEVLPDDLRNRDALRRFCSCSRPLADIIDSRMAE